MTDRDIQDVVARVTGMYTPDIEAIMKEYGVDPETTIRLSLLGSKCRQRRVELGWDLKQAAMEAGVPRSRIGAIESGGNKETSQKEVRLYVRLLGISIWFAKWQRANRQAFLSLPVEPDQHTAWARNVRGTNA